MKVKLLYILLFCTVTKTYSQLETPNIELVKKFLNTKTCFVLDNDPFSECNIQLKTSAEKFWTLTPYEIIGLEEFEKRRKKNEYSFVSIDEVYFDNEKNPIKYKFLCIYLGGNYKTESDMPQIVTIPLAYAEDEESNYAYKIGTILIFAQNHIQTLLQNPDLKKFNIIEYYNKNKEKLENKTLYLLKDEVEPQLQSEIAFKRIYPYSFKFVTREEIEQAIDNKNPDVVFLHKVGPGKKYGSKTYKIILSTKDAKIYYFDYHTVSQNKPDAILESDIKNLIK